MNLSSELCWTGADNAFGPTVHGCRGDFDFTLTFEQAFFSLAPSAVVVIASAARLPYLLRREKLVEANAFKWLKVGTIAAFAALQLALVLLWATRPYVPARGIGIAAAAISFLAAVTLCLLSPLEHARSLTPSTISCCYLLLTILFDATILRTLWIFNFDDNVRSVFTASFSLKAVVLFLEAKEKHRFVSSQHEEARSPEEFSGVYGKSLYWWLNSLMRTGFKEVLVPETLYPLPATLHTTKLASTFWKVWNKSKSLSKHRISFVLLDALKWPILAPIIPRLLLIGFTFCQPLLLQRTLDYLQDPAQRQHANAGYGLIGAYFLTYFGMAALSAVYWLLTYRSLTMIRGMLVAAIYQKMTTIGLTTVDNAKAMTLMGTDAERVIRGIMDFHELWASVVQVGLSTWFLARQLGVAAVGPIIVCLLSFVATMGAGILTTKYQLAWIGAIQERISATSAMLDSIQSVRTAGLSSRVHSLVHNLRLNEIKRARDFWFLGSFSSTIGQVPQVLSPVVTFTIFTAGSVAKNRTLDFSRMFTSLAFLILLTQPLFNLIAGAIDFISALGCFDRINTYLVAESREDCRKLLGNSGDSESNAIELQDVAATWKKDNEASSALRDISLALHSSKLTFVIGAVASGKSTLLKMILGELHVTAGDIRISSKEIAFCDQTPWLFNGTVRDNITGFSSFDAAYYQSVLQACALHTDLKELKNGDMTKVGSKGFSLSSGQKQRIALARAIYSRKSIVLLDDVLSQLDNNTQRHVFAHVLGPHGLLRKNNATVVFATHSVDYLPFSDSIVALENGNLQQQGRFGELRVKKDGYLHKLLSEHTVEDQSKLQLAFDAIIEATGNTDTSQFDLSNEKPPTAFTQKEDEALPKKDQHRLKGDTSIYVYYLSCLGPALTLCFFFLQIFFSFFTVFPNIWLKWWASSNSTSANSQNAQYAGAYAAFQFAGLLSSGILTWFSFNIMAQKAGLELHTKILTAAMRAPLSFLGSVDSGSVITKFSQDFQLVDSSLPLALMCVVTNLFITLGQAGLIASASAWVVVSFPVLVGAFYGVQRYYLRTSRQIRLLDLEQKEPLYTQFTESVQGVATLRAFGWSADCISRNHELVDNSQRPFYLMYMIQKWLSLVLDLIITALAVVVVGIAVGLRNSVSVGSIGVSLSQIISLTSYMKMIVLFWTQMETSLGAVSRIKSFSEEAGNENTDEETVIPDEQWPEVGGVEIQNLTVTYRSKETPHVALKDVSLSIAPNTKTAICGRTGSGKTTLLLALLKLVDSEGSITIDNIPHATISRNFLRERLIVVSDEAFLLPGGSLRENLNPHAYAVDDSVLCTILQEVLLWDVFSAASNTAQETPTTTLPECEAPQEVTPSLSGLLSASISSTPLSHGQKQLFALARALVRQLARGADAGGLVILDEATSRTDKTTDAVLQRVIRKFFARCTLVVIAHRLESVMDFEKVVVLDKGRVVESGSPEELRAAGGLFAGMLGEAM